MQQSKCVVPHVHKSVEEPLLQTHAYGNCPHDLHVHLLAVLKEVHHVGLETIELAILGPLVRVVRIVLPPDLEALLHIRRGFPHLVYIIDVQQLRDLFPARRRVAAVGLGRGPAKVELGLIVLREEGG